jgi:DNA-binding NarL/FixJ family response regulator
MTDRQKEIAALIAKGFSNKQIARALGITEGTVKTHLHLLYEKVGVSNRTLFAIHVLDQGLLQAS